MATHVICISPLETAAQARELLRTYRVSALPVEDDARRAVGIVTATDLAQAGEDALIRDVMTTGVFTVPKLAEAHVAARLMRRHRVHHLLVTEGGSAVGIISSFDLLRVVEDWAGSGEGA
jgi:CBS domain-containing protein